MGSSAVQARALSSASSSFGVRQLDSTRVTSAMDTEALGLRSSYTFKETHVSTTRDRHDVQEQLRRVIAPVVRQLESRRLIDGFHYIVHQQIDLRLSCNDWHDCEAPIRGVLSDHGIPSDLTDWALQPPEDYGGEIGILLCYNNLEYNSRLCLALAELIAETQDEVIRTRQEGLCPHQWLHYLCNQFGYLNLDQIAFEFNDAFVWLQTLLRSNPGNTQVAAMASALLARVRGAADQFEKDFLGT